MHLPKITLLLAALATLPMLACASASDSEVGDDSVSSGIDDESVETPDDVEPDVTAKVRPPRAPGVDPYAGILGLRDDALKSALYELVRDHRSMSYDRAKDEIFKNPAYREADGMIECAYTARRVQPNGSTAPGGFNTEHSWPQSLGATGVAKSDLHHLFPTDARVNSSRGNHPFDEVGCLEEGATSTCSFSMAGSALGKNAAGRTAFEVRIEKRGDIARAHFYFSIRYNKRIGPDEERALRAWNEQDPVDAIELRRNDLIEEKQLNRDPFVDHPEFVAAISDF